MPANLSVRAFQQTYEKNVQPVNIQQLLTPYDANLANLTSIEAGENPPSNFWSETLDMLAEDTVSSQVLGVGTPQSPSTGNSQPCAYGSKAFFEAAQIRHLAQTTLTTNPSGNLTLFWPSTTTYGPMGRNSAPQSPGPWKSGIGVQQSNPGPCSPPILGTPKGRPRTVRRRAGEMHRRARLHHAESHRITTGNPLQTLPTSGPTGQESAIQRCGTCHRPGHNARTCRQPPFL